MPVFLAIILLFAGQVALTDDTSDASACAPAGPDLIAGLYQFDLFQQNAIEAADRSGSEELRLSAVSKADAATQRDKALLELQRKTGTEVQAPGKSAARNADRLAGLDSGTEPGSARESPNCSRCSNICLRIADSRVSTSASLNHTGASAGYLAAIISTTSFRIIGEWIGDRTISAIVSPRILCCSPSSDRSHNSSSTPNRTRSACSRSPANSINSPVER